MITLGEYAKSFNIGLDAKKEALFADFCRDLIEANKNYNLTAIEDEESVYIKHFLDSVSVFLSEISFDKKRIIDVGSGAGFPGIPVSIMTDSSEVFLLETSGKRCNFLSEEILKLNLKNTQVLNMRAEDAGRDDKFRESFDIAVSRAVSSLNILAEYMLPLLKVGGYAICYKGPENSKEIEEARMAILTLGGKITSTVCFELPNNLGGRELIIIKKTDSTPDKYPRKAGIPAKRPLK